MNVQRPTRPLQTIMTTAKTVSRASVGNSWCPNIIVEISATSMMVTDRVSKRVP